MKKLKFPGYYNFNIQEKAKSRYIFDPVRKKYILLTPEEWVRQHVLQFFIQDMQYPPGLLAIEKEFRMHNLQKRADIVVYNRMGRASLLVECKAPQVKMNQSTLEQAINYNLKLNVKYFYLTNGLKHFVFVLDYNTNKIEKLDHIPDFQELSS